MIKALAKSGVFRFNCAKKGILYVMISIGWGIQFCLTPSMINISFLVLLYVNVKGKGPANLLASFQSAKGELGGNGTGWFSVLNRILKLD